MKLLKPLSVLLSVLLAASVAVTTVTASDETQNYETVTNQTWDADNLSNLEGSGLTTDFEGKLSSSTRLVSVGNKGYGIWAYLSPSIGNYLTVTAGHTYVCEAQVWVEEYISPDPSGVDWTDSVENWFNADCWVYAPIDKTFTSTPLTKEAYEAAPTLFDETYGYPYKSIQMTIEVPESVPNGNDIIIPSGNSEFRFYTNGFTKFKHYRMFVYDETADPFLTQPVLNMDASISNPYNVHDHLGDPENYVECDNYLLNPGLYLSVNNAADCNHALLLGNAGKTLSQGKYIFDYSLDYTYIRESSDILSVEITKNGQPFISKSFNDSELPEDGIISIPFEADEQADYRANLYVNNNASLTLKSIELKQEVPTSEIAAVDQKIAEIGEVKYDPDVDQDSGDVIEQARNAYNELAAKYGEISSKLKNYSLLIEAENVYANLNDEYDGMIENALMVDETISNIETPITLDSEESIVMAEEIYQSFLDTFGEEKANLHITMIANLTEARRLLDEIKNPSVVYGDVTGEGDVTVDDALLALQGAVGKIQLTEQQTKSADVDGTQGVTVSDALLILQKAVGKIEGLPIEG